MATPTQSQLDQFHIDRQLLPYNDNEIAKRLRIGRANYSKYINGHITITRAFLAKFNKEFGPELTIIKEQLAPYPKNRNVSPEIEQLLAHTESRLIIRIEKAEENITQIVIEYAKRIERLVLPLIVEKHKDTLGEIISNTTKEYLKEKELEKSLNKKPPTKKLTPKIPSPQKPSPKKSPKKRK